MRNIRLRTLIAEALAQEFRDWAEHSEMHLFTVRDMQVKVTVEFVKPDVYNDEVWTAYAKRFESTQAEAV